ncbi:hypothetical protein EUGRSUZ_H01147 [Eucalyptus grandis]|uniref:Uncharacterized protein n=2 Tax=Eucalyptus grandis TaxID=71139 RepID=A0ACC3JQQ0_EUCGR|nr:hypothetical protein EUGRSUZ_H01147 [Eucalyptus grandis]
MVGSVWRNNIATEVWRWFEKLHVRSLRNFHKHLEGSQAKKRAYQRECVKATIDINFPKFNDFRVPTHLRHHEVDGRVPGDRVAAQLCVLLHRMRQHEMPRRVPAQPLQYHCFQVGHDPLQRRGRCVGAGVEELPAQTHDVVLLQLPLLLRQLQVQERVHVRQDPIAIAVVPVLLGFAQLLLLGLESSSDERDEDAFPTLAELIELLPSLPEDELA